jgi:hypothetical protein
LIIFDRYYDDIYIDPKRFRYGGNITIAKYFKKIIPKPDLNFILITDKVELIHKRKEEINIEELSRQINEYNKIINGKKFLKINVDDNIENITLKIINHIMDKMEK